MAHNNELRHRTPNRRRKRLAKTIHQRKKKTNRTKPQRTSSEEIPKEKPAEVPVPDIDHEQEAHHKSSLIHIIITSPGKQSMPLHQCISMSRVQARWVRDR
jgi:hypothetical protein